MGRYGTVGLELVLSMAVGYYLGRWVDKRWFGAHGYGTAIGAMLGVYAGFRALWIANKRAIRDAERAEREAKDEEDS